MTARRILFCMPMILALAAAGQAQVDKGDKPGKGKGIVNADMAVRLRVTKSIPEQKTFTITWRRGGQGLGGEVIKGPFTAEDKKPEIAAGAWTAWLPLAEIVGRKGGWVFPNLIVAVPGGQKAKKKNGGLTGVVVEFEFAEKGKTFRSFTETAPKGSTVSFAFPGGAADRNILTAQLQGLSSYARARRERLEKQAPQDAPLPKLFGILGHLGGYGEGAGYGIRHCNPEIVRDECRTLRLLGINGMVGEGSVARTDDAGLGKEFRRVIWGGPGAGSPMTFLKKKAGPEGEACPFDPALKTNMAGRVQTAIEGYQRVKAQESWSLWWDEIGVAARDHIVKCPRCRSAFQAYLRGQGLKPADFGKQTWDEVAPFPVWKPADKAAGKKKGKGGDNLAPPPTSAPEALRYYYTLRLLTHATAQLFPESAKKMKEAGVRLYSMQGPTPSWRGSNLDWHEFYDGGANTAIVWETSNRDARVWQWESYLADIARGIAARHDLPIGCLIKPHRGAPQQRMLAVVSRGTKVFEWYTYGPDYAKGDSFSQRPDLLDQVARAGRFLGQAEDWLYDARWAKPAEVAFVSPRSSEIWGKASGLGGPAFEDAKWVYLALAHAHIPVDILSEQQLAAGKLGQYKVMYIVGPNLRRDAAGKVKDWVRAGGVLWTNALGLGRDEANQPAEQLTEMLGLGQRKLESWGSVPGYHAVGLGPLTETATPAHAVLEWSQQGAWGKGKVQARIGREPLDVKAGEVLARFADGKPALVRHPYGKGEVVIAGLWAGLTYSAKVRRPDFDMRADFDQASRNLIVAPALGRNIYRPVLPAEPTVEAVYLTKPGRRSVALINWSYASNTGRPQLQEMRGLVVGLPGVAELKSVRSLVHGKLTIQGKGKDRHIILPKLEAIDLLMLE